MRIGGTWLISIGFFILIAIDVYITLLINTIFNAHTFLLDPGKMIGQFYKTGIPTTLFFFVFIASILVLYYIGKVKLGESFTEKIFPNGALSFSNMGTFGTARVALPKEYKNFAIIQRVEDAYGNIFGKFGEDKDGHPLVANYNMHKMLRNQNIFLMGAAGSGKSAGYVINNIIQAIKRRESIIVTDPKGELYRIIAAFARKHKYIVRILNLKDFRKSDGWDIIKTCIRDDCPVEDAEEFSKAVILNLFGGGDKNDIFVSGPMALLKALVLRVKLGKDFSNTQPQTPGINLIDLPIDDNSLHTFGTHIYGKKNMKSVFMLLQHPNGMAFLDKFFDKEVLRRVGAMDAYAPYASFKQGSQALVGNVVTNLASSLTNIQSELIQDVLSTDDIDLELPGKRPCIYFCIISDTQSTYQFIISLFFTMLYSHLAALADDQDTGSLPVPVNFMMDEFPHIGYLPDWEKRLGTSRSRRIAITMVSQDMALIQNRYGELLTESILGNCAAHISVGINDRGGADYFSFRSGKTTTTTTTESHSTGSLLGSSGRGSTSHGETQRNVRNPDEILRTDYDTIQVYYQGHNLAEYQKLWYWENPEYEKFPRGEDGEPIISRISALPNFGTEERKKFNEENLRAADEYLKEHPIMTVKERRAFYKKNCVPYDKNKGIFAWFNNGRSIYDVLDDIADWLEKDKKDRKSSGTAGSPVNGQEKQEEKVKVEEQVEAVEQEKVEEEQSPPAKELIGTFYVEDDESVDVEPDQQEKATAVGNDNPDSMTRSEKADDPVSKGDLVKAADPDSTAAPDKAAEADSTSESGSDENNSKPNNDAEDQSEDNSCDIKKRNDAVQIIAENVSVAENANKIFANPDPEKDNEKKLQNANRKKGENKSKINALKSVTKTGANEAGQKLNKSKNNKDEKLNFDSGDYIPVDGRAANKSMQEDAK